MGLTAGYNINIETKSQLFSIKNIIKINFFYRKVLFVVVL